MYYTWKSLPVCVYPRNIAVARNTGSPYTSHWRTDGRYAILSRAYGPAPHVPERRKWSRYGKDRQRKSHTYPRSPKARSRLHFQLHISPCTPPQGREETIISPISQYLIPVPDKLLIRQLVPMSLAIQRIRLVVDSSSCL